MADGYEVVAEQLRAHARNIEAVHDRFGAVKSASAHITQGDGAYGTLCQWMPGVLEARHVRQDELIAYVEENLSLVAQRLRQDADAYDEADRWAADQVKAFADEAGWTQ